MKNIVLLNMPQKRQTVDTFLKSRGIQQYQLVKESDDLIKAIVLQSACNIYVFDYYLDISIITTIQSCKDLVNNVLVFVPETRMGHPYRSITNDIHILPNEVDILAWFWDTQACSLRNVVECENCDKPFLQVDLPKKSVYPDRLTVDIRTQAHKDSYSDINGKSIPTKYNTLRVKISAKGKPYARNLDIRKQQGLYSDEEPAVVEPIVEVAHITKEEVQKPIKPKRELPKFSWPKSPKPKKIEPSKDLVVEKQDTIPVEGHVEVDENIKGHDGKIVAGKLSRNVAIDMSEIEQLRKSMAEEHSENKLDLDDEVIDLVPELFEKVEQESVEETVTVEKIVEPERVVLKVDKPVLQRSKVTVDTTAKPKHCSTVEEYVLVNGYMTEEQQALVREAVKSSDKRFAETAIDMGYLTDIDCVTIYSHVYNMEIVPWSIIEAMSVNDKEIPINKFRDMKFFRTEDTSDGDVQLIMSIEITKMDGSIRRVYDNPRIRYTLDRYITEKLK